MSNAVGMNSLAGKTRPRLHGITESSIGPSKRPSSPRSPRLEKLNPGLSSPCGQRSKDNVRLKDLREQALVRKSEEFVQAERNQQEQQRSFLYHTRWLQLRNFYAVMCETMEMARERKASPMSPLHPRGPSTPLVSISSAPSSPAKPPIATSTTTQPTAPAVWLREIASEFRRAFPFPEITMTQLEIAINKALHIDLLTTPAFAEVTARLKAVLQAFQRPETLKVDFRELLCALVVLDRWRVGERKLVMLWFEEFATVPMGSKSLAIAKQELKRMLFTACEGSADEKSLIPFINELLGNAAGSSYITESVFSEYVGERTNTWCGGNDACALLRTHNSACVLVDSTPKLLEILKAQCWKRLTDDMRLAFYRDLFVQASDKLEEEQLRFRMEAATKLWRSHEPRRIITRWMLFVADRKLKKRSDAHFRRISSRRMVAALLRQRRRRQQMRDLVAIARVQYHGTLLFWTFQAWKLFYDSMQLLNRAAEKRSTRHYCRVWKRKTLRSLVKYYLVRSVLLSGF